MNNEFPVVKLKFTEILAGLVKADSIPMIWGLPGTGKTSMILNDIPKLTGRPVIYVPLGGKQPEEITGFLVDPGEGSKSLEVKIPFWADIAYEYGNAVIFVDEFGSCIPETQAGALSVLRERVIGRYTLPKETRFIAAGNPLGSAANGVLLAPPMANRLVHLDYNVNAQEWADSMTTRFGFGFEDDFQASCYALVAGYILSNPGSVIKMPEDPVDSSRGWPSPRTWEEVAKMVYQFKGVEAHSIFGAVGEGEGRKFLHYVANRDLPPAREVLEKAETFKIPEKEDKFHVLLASVITLASSDLKFWENAWTIIGRALAVHPQIAYPAACKYLVFGESKGLSLPEVALAPMVEMMKKSRLVEGL